MKIIGFNQGQIGDLVLNIPACRAIKQKYPDSKLIFSINKKYKHVAPLFYHNPLIDDFVFWDGYDDWPNEKDKEIIDNIQPDLLFHPMPKVIDDYWINKMHFTEIVCRNYGITPPDNLHTTLIKYFDTIPKYKNCIAINPFSSSPNSGRDLPEELCYQIIDLIHHMGYETIQLGIKNHKQYPTTYPISDVTIFDDTVIALSCKLTITIDSGMNYILSGYNHKVLGLYGKVYPIDGPIKNRTPINKNAIYLENESISDILLSDIDKSLEKLL